MNLKPSRIGTTSSFDSHLKRYLKMLTPKEKILFGKRMRVFQENVFEQRLKTHTLKGELKNFWAFSIFYSDRIIFELNGSDVILRDIDDHDVYR